MIFVYKGDKFKKDKAQTSADLIADYKLDDLSDTKELDKQVSKGNHVYCWMSPFQFEINGKNSMRWGLNELKELRNFHQSNEEV